MTVIIMFLEIYDYIFNQRSFIMILSLTNVEEPNSVSEFLETRSSCASSIVGPHGPFWEVSHRNPDEADFPAP